MKFKCKQSGVVIEFIQEQDIKSTLTNPAYEVYEEEIVKKETKKVESKKANLEEV